MSFRSARLAALAAVAAAASHLELAQSDGLEEIVVTADFREARIEELPVSVTSSIERSSGPRRSSTSRKRSAAFRT